MNGEQCLGQVFPVFWGANALVPKVKSLLGDGQTRGIVLTG